MRPTILLMLAMLLCSVGCKKTSLRIPTDSPEYTGSSTEFEGGTPEYIGGVPAGKSYE